MNPTVWNWNQTHQYELTVLKMCSDRDRDTTEIYREKEGHTEKETGIALDRQSESERSAYMHISISMLCPLSGLRHNDKPKAMGTLSSQSLVSKHKSPLKGSRLLDKNGFPRLEPGTH